MNGKFVIIKDKHAMVYKRFKVVFEAKALWTNAIVSYHDNHEDAVRSAVEQVLKFGGVIDDQSNQDE